MPQIVRKKKTGRATNQGVKLIIIRDYLCSETDETHYATSQDIIEHLESKGIRADRKTIFNDITRLQNDLGLKIERKKHCGFRILEPKFEPNELRLMVDSVQSAKFITQKEADTLKKKNKSLGTVHSAKDLERTAYVSRRARSKSENITKHTDKIHSAITANHKLSFRYFHFSSGIGEPKKKYSRNSADATEWVVSPFALYWSDGNYYLYAYSDSEDKFRFFRIDRMESIRELALGIRDGIDKYSKKTLTASREYVRFKMFSGKETVVVLEGKNLNYVIDGIVDEFGKELLFAPLNGGKSFRVQVPVELSPPFYAWLSTFGNDVKITRPPEAVEGMKKFIAKVVSAYADTK